MPCLCPYTFTFMIAVYDGEDLSQLEGKSLHSTRLQSNGNSFNEMRVNVCYNYYFIY